MAINSLNERACCICMALPVGRVYPFPDTAIDGADRQHLALSWRSISAGALNLIRQAFLYYRRLRL